MLPKTIEFSLPRGDIDWFPVLYSHPTGDRIEINVGRCAIKIYENGIGFKVHGFFHMDHGGKLFDKWRW